MEVANLPDCHAKVKAVRFRMLVRRWLMPSLAATDRSNLHCCPEDLKSIIPKPEAPSHTQIVSVEVMDIRFPIGFQYSAAVNATAIAPLQDYWRCLMAWVIPSAGRNLLKVGSRSRNRILASTMWINLVLEQPGNIWGATDMSNNAHNGFEGLLIQCSHTVTGSMEGATSDLNVGDLPWLLGVCNNWFFFIPNQ